MDGNKIVEKTHNESGDIVIDSFQQQQMKSAIEDLERRAARREFLAKLREQGLRNKAYSDAVVVYDKKVNESLNKK